MKKNRVVRLKWQCEICKDIKTSYSHKRHDMNMCKCGKSGVDLEEWYQRNIGKVKELERTSISL